MNSSFRTNKLAKKQQKYLKLLEKDLQSKEKIEETTSPNILLGNVGILTGNIYEDVFELFNQFQGIEDVFLFPNKTYSLVKMSDSNLASTAVNKLNGSYVSSLDKIIYLIQISDSVTKCLINQCKESYSEIFKHQPKGLKVITNVISEEEEKQLINLIDWASDGSIQSLKNRKVKHFGRRFDYSLNGIVEDETIRPIPDLLISLMTRWKNYQLINHLPDQITVNYYEKGQGIPPHIDTHSCCENELVSLSLISQIVMDFNCLRTKARSSVVLPQRSLLILHDEARYAWNHSIACRRFDPTMDLTTNQLTFKERSTRLSFTFRKFKTTECQCDFPEFCDSRKNIIPNQISMEKMENEYVYKVYDQIAGDFDRTRYKPWPKVKKFLDSLQTGSIVCDIGCGNGKYLNTTSHTINIGCDTSLQLLEICRQRNMEVIGCNILNLPFKESSIDHIICIAVLHHLASSERRIAALTSMSKLLIVGGTCLVYVWAMEQVKDGSKSVYIKSDDHKKTSSTDCQSSGLLPVHSNRTEFKQQDLFVPWKSAKDNRNYLRFYHVFREGELEDLVHQVPEIKIVESYYDQGNWCVIFSRIG